MLSVLSAMLSLLFISINVDAQKALSEGSFVYEIIIQPKNSQAKSTSALNGAKTTVYLKGGLSRTEMASALGNEITIYNNKLGNAVILKEYSGQKLMITLTKDNWVERNRRFDGITFENTTEVKVINGYNCKKALAKLPFPKFITTYLKDKNVSLNLF